MTRRVDYLLVGAVLGLVAMSTMLVWSASEPEPQAWVGRQLVSAMIGLGLMWLIWISDTRWLRIGVPLAYLTSLAGLVMVLLAGTVVNGSKSWLMIAGFSFQPSEFAKLSVVTAIAAVAAETTGPHGRLQHLRDWSVPAMIGVVAIPAGLVLAQPDLGTLMILAIIAFGTLVAAGASWRWLAGLAAAAVAGVWLVISTGLLARYQVDRLLAFMDPSLDPKGAGYNVTQSQIAVGNGGLWGQGLFHGSQTQSGFVPEQHTDFIFTVAAEELGLVGAGLLVGLLAVVAWRCLRIARTSATTFGRVVGVGMACWIGVQSFWNVGMCLGIMPVTGIPLPLVSYGGSAMIALLIGVGILLALDSRGATGPQRSAQPRSRDTSRSDTVSLDVPALSLRDRG